MSSEVKYRPEIDGLRTIAVLGVIAFHLEPQFLPGGFLGVDVFLVISGYLITSILSRQIREERFSLWSFWKRRIKRLYPALVATTAATLFVGAWVLPQPERGQLPLQAIAALFSFSNILLWRTTGGYWSTASESIPLLHTWSLSLEEQFYICFPLTLVFCHMALKRQTTKAIFTVLVSSLILGILLAEFKPVPAFYLLPTRMWELLLGGLLAIHQPALNHPKATRRYANLIHAFGIALILLSYLMIESAARFSGLHPLAPCLGTALLLASQNQHSPVTRTLSTPIFVYIGKISYSLYLWHWPILVYAYYTNPTAKSSVILLTSLITASASYHIIEQPFRSKPRRPLMWASFGVATVILCLLGFQSPPASPLLAHLGDFDTPLAISRGEEYEATANLRDSNYKPQISANGQSIVILGSSHARVLCKPFDHFAEKNNYAFHSLASSGIGITTDHGTLRPYCREVNERRIHLIEEMKPNFVIVAGMWNFELSSENNTSLLKRRLQTLAANADKVLVLGQVPLIDLPPKFKEALRKYVTAHAISRNPIRLKTSTDVADSNGLVAEIIEQLGIDNIEFIDPTETLTTQEGFAKVFNDQHFLYSDYHHVNDSGASLIFEAHFRQRLIDHIGSAN